MPNKICQIECQRFSMSNDRLLTNRDKSWREKCDGDYSEHHQVLVESPALLSFRDRLNIEKLILSVSRLSSIRI